MSFLYLFSVIQSFLFFHPLLLLEWTYILLLLPWLRSQEPQGGLDPCFFYICIERAWYLLCDNTNSLS